MHKEKADYLHDMFNRSHIHMILFRVTWNKNTITHSQCAYSLDPLAGALEAQQDVGKALVDWVSTQIAEGGTQRPGFFS